MSDVAVVGSFNVDHVWRCDALPHAGETRTGRYSTGPGGKGFNQAVASARAGASTSFVCALGDDLGGQLARALAEADGIALVDQRSEHPTGTAGIYVDAHGRNSIVIGAGANGDLRASFVESQWAVIAQARVVLAQCESPGDAVLVALRIGLDVGATTVLNPAPANADVDVELLVMADILTPNETEFAALLGKHCGVEIDPDSLAATDSATLHAHCRNLLPQGSVVITLGAEGAFVSHAAGQLRGDDLALYRVPAYPATPIDTTGAGDAFSGALAASLSQLEQPFAEHVRFAARYAARSTETAGAAASMPRLAPLGA
ncbi:Ribokinase [Lysobacter dokdonensis DS-58]|uniref:Ribokinase n=1 Tax=Lysobacter dokdonensis DS-58 TaxID=1300345 RepID=A0A0A2WKB3_9GAMM|nr:ribokinase [Lysobacter dokdonensis]KGQ18675.1 Ribokinase [Lysobacter dokdonensis DS-58]